MKNLALKYQFGKISLVLALANILLFIFSFGAFRLFQVKGLAPIWIIFSLVSIPIGIITGGIGLFAKRTSVGLVLNLILAIFIYKLIFEDMLFPPTIVCY